MPSRISRAAVLVALVPACTAPHARVPPPELPPVTDQVVDERLPLLLSGRDRTVRSAITGDARELAEGLAQLERAVAAGPGEPWANYHLAYAHYVGMIQAEHARAPDAAAFERHAAGAVHHARAALASPQESAEAAALLSAIHGVEISHSNWLGMTLGPESDALVERALREAPECPRAWLVRGLSLYFTPALFGGDQREARAAFERAVALFESSPAGSATTVTADLRPDWGHAECCAWLGQVRLELGDPRGATEAYERALQLEPEYPWVRERLLPEARRVLAAQP